MPSCGIHKEDNIDDDNALIITSSSLLAMMMDTHESCAACTDFNSLGTSTMPCLPIDASFSDTDSCGNMNIYYHQRRFRTSSSIHEAAFPGYNQFTKTFKPLH